jgi:hypothetical protein
LKSKESGQNLLILEHWSGRPGYHYVRRQFSLPPRFQTFQNNIRMLIFTQN